MSWPLVPLSEVVIVNPRLSKNVNEKQKVSFVAMASASDEGFLLNEEVRVLAETKKGFTYFDRGDVLLAKITPCFENGKCLRANQISNQIGFGSTEFHVLRAIPEKIDSTYLFYMIWSNKFRSMGEASMSGAAGQKRVSADFLKGFEVPLPPLTKQKSIAAILDKADAIRRKRQQAIQLADEFLRAVFLGMFGDPVTNPKGWEVRPLGDIVDNKDGKRVPIKSSDRSNMSGDYPYYGASGIIDHVNDYIFEGRNLLIGEDGANLLARSTPVAFIADGSYWVNNHAHVLGEKDLTLEYLAYSINMRSLEPYVSGSAQPKLNQASMNLIPIAVPPKKLEVKFLRIIDLMNRVTTKLSGFKSVPIFAALSQRAYSGKL